MSTEPRHLAFAREHYYLMAAPNGARRTKEDHPALPLCSVELARCAAELAEAGAAAIHLHVRDENGRHTLDVATYQHAIMSIRGAVGDRLVIQVTTEAVGQYAREAQIEMVRELRPEAVSLALREICPDAAAERDAAELFAFLARERRWPQIILYDIHDLQRFEALRSKGLFARERPHALFVLGRYAGDNDGRPEDLDTFLAAATCEEFPWAVCCFGRHEQAAAQRAVDAGGHVRVGFENNLWLSDGALAGDNAALVRQCVEVLAGQPRQPATADELREFVFAA